MTTFRLYNITNQPGTIYAQTPFVVGENRETWQDGTCLFFPTIQATADYINTNGGALGGFSRDEASRRFRWVCL